MSTALLREQQLPAFNEFSTQDFKPAFEALISGYNSILSEVVLQEHPSWDSAIAPLSDASRKIDHVWSILSHLKAVADTDELREIYNELSAKLTRFRSEVSQNEELYKLYERVVESSDLLNEAQTKVLENTLRGFRLSGVALPADKKDEFKQLSEQLVALTNRFAENVLDSTQAWSLYLEDADPLAGVPEATLKRLAERAKQKSYSGGYLLGLDITIYLPVMQYCVDRSIREALYRGFITRASSAGGHQIEHANEQIMVDIMSARKKKADLLDLPSYASLSVEPKMAESPEQVLEFLEDLLKKAKPLALEEMAILTSYANERFGICKLEAWDVAFVSEALRKERFDIDQEALRPYFPLPVVLEGLFSVAEKLFGVQIREIDGVSLPVPETRCFCIERDGQAQAYIYMDLYSREGKRGGAWVSPCHKLTKLDSGEEIRPLAFLVCNFSSPTEDVPSLLTHTEIVTLFHEFGHALHHCVTKISYPEVSGLSGVPWDAVELPSQFLENWCWQGEALQFLSKHVDTGESLPDELINKLTDAKSFLAGMQTLRQLEFGLFDFRLHHHYEIGETDIQACIEEVQREVSVVPVPEFARFANAFSHIFAGGYAAGYYSYKWAEVLSADAFSAFEEEGVFNRSTGERFKSQILERGGAGDIGEMFKAFRGRMPNSQALLKQMGV